MLSGGCMSKSLVRKFVRPCLLASALSGVAFAGSNSPDLTKINPSQTVQVIVQYASQTGVSRSALAVASPVLAGAGIKKGDLPGGALFQMSAGAALLLARQSGVKHVSLNHKIQGTGSAVPVYDFMPQTIQTGVGDFANSQGFPVGVAIIDSGVRVNADLNGSVVYSESFVPGESTDDLY